MTFGRNIKNKLLPPVGRL